MKRLVAPVALMVVCMFVAVGPARANTYSVTGPTLASGGASPFAAGCGGPGEGFHTSTEVAGVNFPDTEIEPWFVVNPQDPNDLAGFWQQDRWSDGGAHGLVAGVSSDGGRTWSTTRSRSRPTRCTPTMSTRCGIASSRPTTTR